jgi:PPK2 family polyphosphate:nucleotide phosphotransferase
LTAASIAASNAALIAASIDARELAVPVRFFFERAIPSKVETPMIDCSYLIPPGKDIRLSKLPTKSTGDFKSKHEAILATRKNIARLEQLQQLLYAEAKHALLIVFQAIDAGGKDGAIEHVFSGVNPQGCSVTSFKQPTELEKRHDFLWREHAALPPRGMIGIFNRSHYESVLVERVDKLTPEKVWSKRYDHINAFEKMLADEGTIILKFFLHISREEQKKRLQARLADPCKNWKFSSADVKERKHWDAYESAFEDAINRCSKKHAPWFVAPSDRKWFRNWVVSDAIVRTLETLDMKFPEPVEALETIKID